VSLDLEHANGILPFHPNEAGPGCSPARTISSLGFAAKYAALPARKISSLGFAAKYAALPARKISSLGFAAKYAAQLMGDIQVGLVQAHRASFSPLLQVK